MGAIEMGLAEEELQPLVDSWRAANSNIVKFWWSVDRAVNDNFILARKLSELQRDKEKCESDRFANVD